jgi:hypothetical protein
VLLPFLLASNPAQVIRVERPGLQALRSGLLAVEGIGFYFAVKYLPLADVVTYWLAAPVYVAALSPLLLGERVGGRAWIAVLIGFAGVLVALQPSAESLTPEALIALAGSAAYAFAMILGRKLRGTPDRVLVFWQIIGAALVSLPGVLFLEGGWTPAGAPRPGFPRRARHRGHAGAHAGEPVVQAGPGGGGHALYVFHAGLGGDLRGLGLRRPTAAGHAGRRCADRRGGPDAGSTSGRTRLSRQPSTGR